MKFLPALALIILAFCQQKDRIVLKTNSGDSIVVFEGAIYYNKNTIKTAAGGDGDIIYSSKYNRLIEQNSSILLFLEMDGRPNLNELAAFKITPHKAIKLAECVYNDKSQGIGPPPFTDMDNDGKLEFGGFDLTEGYEAKDSMYYIPSEYYEITGGTVVFDSLLARQMDIKVNGLYLKHPLGSNGNCCVVIKKPVTKGLSKH